MDFTSIKHGLTGSIKRFPHRRRVGTIGMVRSAIQPRFADWIRGHWQFLEGRLFSAVPLSFQHTANPFGQISWPQSRKTTSSVVMAPRIQLNLRLTPITNVFSEGNTSHSLFSDSTEIGASFYQTAVFPRTTVPATLLTRESWSNFFQFNNRLRETAVHRGATTFRTTERLSEQLTRIFERQRDTRSSKTTERPLLTTISSAVRQFTHSLKSNLVQHLVERQEAGDVRDRRETANEKVLREWTGTRLSLTRFLKNAVEFNANRVDSWEFNKLNKNVTSSTHSFLALLHNSKFSGGPVPPAYSIPDVSRQFAVSRSSGPDAMARQIQYFGPPPNLSYVKRESPQLQQLVSTLKEARTAQTQVRTPEPEFPSVAQLTTHVRQELERELRIERERRGL